MYLDEKNEFRPSEPAKPARRLTVREEKIMLSAIGVFLLSMLIAPIGGATVIQALFAALGL